MNGGGGDAPRQPTPSGGEFLLHLLQNPPQHHHQSQTPPQPPPPSNSSSTQSLTHDPAVAAVGSSLSFPPWPSNGHHLSTTPPPPPPCLHNNLPLSPPYPPHFLGFLQNPPWSVPPASTNIPRGPLQSPLTHHVNGVDDDVRKLGISGTDGRVNSVSNNQSERSSLMFGSFPCEIRTQDSLSKGNSVFGAARDGLISKPNVSKEGKMGVGDGSLNGPVRNRQFELAPQNSNAYGQSGSGYRQNHNHHHNHGFSRPVSGVVDPRRPPPPGFFSKPGLPNKQREMGNLDSWRRGKGFEHNVDNGKKVSELNHQGFISNNAAEKLRASSREHIDMRDGLAELGLSEQLDRPGPLSRSKLHSASALEVGESARDLHREHFEIRDKPLYGTRDKTRSDVGQGSREFDDLNELLIKSLGLDDGSEDKNDTRQCYYSRDRDVKSEAKGRRLLSQRMRNFKSQLECRSDIDTRNASFLEIYESLVPAEEEKAKQKQLMALLEKLVCKEWPRACLYLYGSCANSFGVSKSDIDVCLAIEDADIDKSEVLLRLADILQSDNLQNVQALTRARVPIVKLRDPETGISCDICINNVLAVVNTKLLRDYAEIDVRLRQLAFIVKHWAKSRGVNETYQGTLSSYAYVVMCIHFLQQRKPAVLPCLQGMKTTYSVTVDDVQCAFFDQVDKLHDFGSGNKESIAQLVWAFFNYWAYCHDYANGVISVRTGSVISKRAKDWTRRVGNDRHLICIEDPFEVSHDLGRVVDKFSIKVLREEFERAAFIMQYDPDPCVTLFEPYVPS